MSAENLLIFGASVRSAAFSAIRAGLAPWCADLFADADLRACCPAMRLPGAYPQAFGELVHTDLRGPWMYTGGLENWPSLVLAMSRSRQLWGNNQEALLRARNPWSVHRALVLAGAPAPALRWRPEELSPEFRWLRKPIRGTGGEGIRFWTGPEGKTGPPAYFQEFIVGEPHAALYVGNGQSAHFLGLTRQLIGEGWLHATGFRYCGTVGPVSLEKVRRPDLHHLGSVLARVCRLRGLFGVDGVLADGVFWVVEINPRYTASVEVLEYALQLPVLRWHVDANTSGTLPARSAKADRGIDNSKVVGKAILFARKELVFPKEGPWLATLRTDLDPQALPAFADIPHAHTVIPAARPILTCFAQATHIQACLAKLQEQVRDLDRWFFGYRPSKGEDTNEMGIQC